MSSGIIILYRRLKTKLTVWQRATSRFLVWFYNRKNEGGLTRHGGFCGRKKQGSRYPCMLHLRQKDTRDTTAYVIREGFASLWNLCSSLERHLLLFPSSVFKHLTGFSVRGKGIWAHRNMVYPGSDGITSSLSHRGERGAEKRKSGSAGSSLGGLSPWDGAAHIQAGPFLLRTRLQELPCQRSEAPQ